MRRSASEGAAEMSAEEHAQLARVLREAGFGGTHLELGTAAGGTLCHMLACLPETQGFVVVDRLRYFDGQREAIEANLQKHGLARERVELREASSASALREATARGERFDFVLIDAGHKLVDVMRDLRWARLLNPGGILCLHDYDDTPAHRGLKLAVDRFEKRHPHYWLEDQTGSLRTLRKTAPVGGEGRSLPREIDALDWLYAALQWLPTRLVRTRAKLAKRARRRCERSSDVGRGAR